MMCGIHYCGYLTFFLCWLINQRSDTVEEADNAMLETVNPMKATETGPISQVRVGLKLVNCIPVRNHVFSATKNRSQYDPGSPLLDRICFTPCEPSNIHHQMENQNPSRNEINCLESLSPREPLELLNPGHHKFAQYSACLPVLVIEIPLDKPNYKMPTVIQDEEKLCQSRMKHLSAIYFVFACGIRLYNISKLDNELHYEVLERDISKMTPFMDQMVRDRTGTDHQFSYHIITHDGPPFSDDNVKVRYDLAPQDLGGLPVDGMISLLLESGQMCPVRKHICKNYGLCDHNNSAVDLKQLGIVYPRKFRDTSNPHVQQMFESLTTTLHAAFPETSPVLYKNVLRNKTFGGKFNLGQGPETIQTIGSVVARNGVSIPNCLMGGHCDNRNEKDDCNMKFVCGLSLAVYNPRLDTVSLVKFVTYCKAAAGRCLRQYEEYYQLLSSFLDFWETMDPEEKYITTKLLGPPDRPEWKTLPRTHSMKTVLYSVYAEAVKGVLKAYPWMMQGPWYVVAMLFNSIVSNCPQHFFNELSRLAKEPSMLGSSIDSYKPSEFCYLLYKHLFWAKENETYPTVQRRQPSNNTRGTEQQVFNSYLSLGRLLMEINALEDNTINGNSVFYHSKAVAHLCQTCPDAAIDITAPKPQCGVLGAGPLLAQELIGLAGILGMVPYCMATAAELCKSTGTYRFLREFKGSPFKMDNSTLASGIWFKALRAKTGSEDSHLEEATCKWKQAMTGTTGRYKDSIPPGIPVTFPDPTVKKLMMLHPCGRIHEKEELPIVADYDLRKPNGDPFSGSPEYWVGNFEGWSHPPKKKTSPSTKPPPTESFLPLRAPAGLTKLEAKAAGKFSIMVPSPMSVILAMTPPLPGSQDDAIDLRAILQQTLASSTKRLPDRDVFIWTKIRVNVTTTSEVAGVKHSRKKRWKRSGVRGARGDKRSSPQEDAFCVGILLSVGQDEFDNQIEEKFFPDQSFALRRLGGSGRSFVLDSDQRRYFIDIEKAKEFAVLCLLFERPHLFSRNPSAREILSVPPTPPLVLEEQAWIPDHKTRQLDQIVSFKVVRHVSTKKSPLPFLVCVLYKQGGMAYFLSNDFGRVDSSVLVRLPLSKARRKSNKGLHDEWNSFIGIAGHTMKNQVFLRIVWEDGNQTDEPLCDFSKDAYYSVLEYAERNNLQNVKGWKGFLRRKTEVPAKLVVGGQPMYPDIHQRIVAGHSHFWMDKNK